MRTYESFKIEGDLEKAFYRGWTVRVYSNAKNTNIFSFTIDEKGKRCYKSNNTKMTKASCLQ